MFFPTLHWGWIVVIFYEMIPPNNRVIANKMPHKIHPIARPQGPAMGCLFGICGYRMISHTNKRFT